MPKSSRRRRLFARSNDSAACISVETETQFGPEPSFPKPRGRSAVAPCRSTSTSQEQIGGSDAGCPGGERSGSLIVSHDRLASPCRAGDLRSSPASRRSRARIARGLTGGRGSGFFATSGLARIFAKCGRMALGSLKGLRSCAKCMAGKFLRGSKTQIIPTMCARPDGGAFISPSSPSAQRLLHATIFPSAENVHLTSVRVRFMHTPIAHRQGLPKRRASVENSALGYRRG